MDREILHITVPAFPIALARAVDSHLRGRPVAVAPLNSERALLQCVSAEAASEGVLAGTPIYWARKSCPSLLVIAPDPHLMAKGSQALTELSAQFTPIVEPGAGRVFLDLTASRRLFQNSGRGSEASSAPILCLRASQTAGIISAKPAITPGIMPAATSAGTDAPGTSTEKTMKAIDGGIKMSVAAAAPTTLAEKAGG